MLRTSRLDTYAANLSALTGVERNLMSLQVLYLDARDLTPPEVVAELQSRAQAIDRARVARAEWVAASHACDEHLEKTQRFMRDLKGFVFARYGDDDLEKLAEFGYAPAATVERTPAEQLTITAKALATRKARHTKGPKARLAITGENPTGAPAVAAPEIVVTPLEPRR